MNNEIISEFIKFLENPAQLKSKDRFSLLKKCYLYEEGFLKDEVSQKQRFSVLEMAHAVNEVNRLHLASAPQSQINEFINNLFN